MGLEMECIGNNGVGRGTTDQKNRVRQERKKEKHQRMIRSGYIRGVRHEVPSAKRTRKTTKSAESGFGASELSRLGGELPRVNYDLIVSENVVLLLIHCATIFSDYVLK
ncbi:hypothetical protein TNCV_64991 [Trichonephila clavipes]|nr:hypothetical protein TNCV_64991 [Trichonephila clavipes]